MAGAEGRAGSPRLPPMQGSRASCHSIALPLDPAWRPEGFRAGVARVWRLWAPSRPPASDARAGTQLQREDTLHGQAHTGSSHTRAPHTRGLLHSWASCREAGEQRAKGHSPFRPRLAACGQLRGPSMGCSLCNDEFLLGPRWTPGHGQGPRWLSPALGSRRHQQAHAESSVLGDRGLPRPVGGLGPARRGCPLLSGHRQRPSGPASEAALGRAPPLRAQKLSGGRQPVPPQGGLFACCSAESPSIRCTQELRGLICFSIGALSLHFLKGLPQAEVSDLMKCDLLMFLLI